VGANAFSHASGIHQDGVLKSRETYEIMSAEDVGWAQNKIVLGKLSGRRAFSQRLRELGIPVASEAELNEAFSRFKNLADRKSQIFDEDIQSLFKGAEAGMAQDSYLFVSMLQQSETGERPQATVVWQHDGQEFSSTCDGNGPVDAAFRAIESLVKSGAELQLYSVNAITTGTESVGDVTVRLAKGGRIVNGVGADPDIIAASVKAYLNALSKLESDAPLSAQHAV
jgi:2-isopropylmalate synthase